MGTYDTFIDHDGRSVQSKAFGKGMFVYRIGDPAQIERAPFTDAEDAQWRAGTWDGSAGEAGRTCQVQCDEGILLTLTDGIFTAMTTERDPALPLFDYFGRDITVLDAALQDPAFAQRHAQATVLAWSHGTAVRAAYQRPEIAERMNTAVAALVWHCAQTQVDPPREVPEPNAYRRWLGEREALRLRKRAAYEEAKAAAGFAGFPDPLATAAQQTAWQAWCMQQALAEASGHLTGDTTGTGEGDEPEDVYYDAEPFALRDPDPSEITYPTSQYLIGTPAPAPAPHLDLQGIADVFVEALTVLRTTEDPDRLYRPSPEAGTRRRPALAPSGEDVYTTHVTAYRRAGLHAVGPGWADRLRDRTPTHGG